MTTIPVSRVNHYQTLLALREAGFSNARIYAAMAALYDNPEHVRIVRDPRKPRPESEPEEPDQLASEAYDWPEWTDDDVWMLWREPEYVPTPQDWADLDIFLSERDCQEYDEAMASADIADAEHERRRFREEELQSHGLAIG